MKNIKRIMALALVLVMALSFTACHKKNEIAVKAKDVEFTSAYYMCALINADSEAKTKVQEELSEEEASAEKIDYYSKKIDGKKYEEWVKDTALASLKEIAAYKLLCKENKVELDEEMLTNAETYASYYWSSYGYSMIYEPNGVAQSTYTQYMKDSYCSEAYFEHLYGKDGEKEIPAKDVKTKIYGSFIIADILDASFTSETEDKEKKEIKTKLDGYVKALNDGTKTFADVYKEYNNVKDEEKTDSDKKDGPKDQYAQILGAKDTVYESEDYDTVKKMKTGEVKLVKLDDDAGYKLIVKQDIKADKYYLENLDSTARHLIKDEEFKGIIEDYQKGFELDVNKYAVNQFKVKKIVEPDYSNYQ